MRRFIEQMSPARRQQIEDESYANDVFGVKRLPDIAHCGEMSDTLLTKALDANEMGLALYEAAQK